MRSPFDNSHPNCHLIRRDRVKNLTTIPIILLEKYGRGTKKDPAAVIKPFKANFPRFQCDELLSLMTKFFRSFMENSHETENSKFKGEN
ncbi:hypothetical protein ACOSQ3_031086 [Xanthoceras sorbifolium]